MINTFLKFKARNRLKSTIEVNDIYCAQKIVFSVFNRYGDTIVNLIVIKEFIERYPDKEYLILCPRQMAPYMAKILPSITYQTVRKRSLFDMLRVDRMLKKFAPDIGFDPASDSSGNCYFITYAKKYMCCKDSAFWIPSNLHERNLYERVRTHLLLPEREYKVNKLTLKKYYNHILICPETTKSDTSIDIDKLQRIIINLQSVYDAKITIASLSDEYAITDAHFKFRKTRKNSQSFLQLIDKVDLAICPDSGPLHIVLALGNKDTVAIFKPTQRFPPEMVINTNSTLAFNEFV